MQLLGALSESPLYNEYYWTCYFTGFRAFARKTSVSNKGDASLWWDMDSDYCEPSEVNRINGAKYLILQSHGQIGVAEYFHDPSYVGLRGYTKQLRFANDTDNITLTDNDRMSAIQRINARSIALVICDA
jgi:hypothetical protein